MILTWLSDTHLVVDDILNTEMAQIEWKKKTLRTFKWTASTHILSTISLLQSKYGNNWRWHRNKTDARIFFIYLFSWNLLLQTKHTIHLCFILEQKGCARDNIAIWTRFRVLPVIDLTWCISFLLIHFH